MKVSVICRSIGVSMTMAIIRNFADDFPQKIKYIIALYTMFSALKNKTWDQIAFEFW